DDHGRGGHREVAHDVGRHELAARSEQLQAHVAAGPTRRPLVGEDQADVAAAGRGARGAERDGELGGAAAGPAARAPGGPGRRPGGGGGRASGPWGRWGPGGGGPAAPPPPPPTTAPAARLSASRHRRWPRRVGGPLGATDGRRVRTRVAAASRGPRPRPPGTI